MLQLSEEAGDRVLFVILVYEIEELVIKIAAEIKRNGIMIHVLYTSPLNNIK